MSVLHSYVVVILLLGLADGLKVLVYSPNFGHSHVTFMGQIADTLQLAGHNVTVIQPITMPEDRGTGCHHAHVITVQPDPDTIHRLKPWVDRLMSPDYWNDVWTMDSRNPMGNNKAIPILSSLFKYTCENLLERVDLITQWREENFDIAVTEFVDYSGFALFHKINVTNIVGAQSFGIFEGTCWAIGAPVVPGYVPATFGAFGDSGTFWERSMNLMFTYFSYRFQMDLLNTVQTIMNERMLEAPTIWDSMSRMPFLIVNSDPFMDFPRPTLEKIVNIGGIGLRKSKALDQKWDSVLGLRARTVLISFGSIAPSKTLPQTMKDNICTVFRSFPNVTFIWKYEATDDGFAKGIENIVLSQWIPQIDLLADSRLSLFMTHGGAGSIMESAHSGVPLITVPIFADQMRNARMMERLESGIYFEKINLADPVLLTDTLKIALNGERLREKAKTLQRLLSKRPFSPQKKLIKTIELAGEFGSMPNLAPSGRNMGFIQYFNLDICALAVVLLFSMLLLIYHLISRTMRICRTSKKAKKE